MGTSEPSAVLSPIASHAPIERSSELALAHPGQLSSMRAWMVMPLFRFVIDTVCPQSDES